MAPFLAKLATELGKPDGLKVITPREALDVLSSLLVSYLLAVRSLQRVKHSQGRFASVR